MKYALRNNERITAKPNLIAKCICCGEEVRPYCGKVITHHWKHIKADRCDSWQENETKWHREWKNKFEKKNQEVIRYNSENGEKHIADIHFHNINLTIEFQHSPIKIDEIKSRESFYKKLIWVIDLTPYKKNVSFNSNIYEAFRKFSNDLIDKEKQLHKKNEDKKSHLDLIKSEKQLFELLEYFALIKKKYFPAYFINNKKSSTARRLLKFIYKKKSENPNIEGQFYSDQKITKLKQDSKLDMTYNHLLMIWKNKHKRWFNAEKPMFFDIGDDYLYRSIENIQSSNGIIVKKYSKEIFINYYKGKDNFHHNETT